MPSPPPPRKHKCTLGPNRSLEGGDCDGTGDGLAGGAAGVDNDGGREDRREVLHLGREVELAGSWSQMAECGQLVLGDQALEPFGGNAVMVGVDESEGDGWVLLGKGADLRELGDARSAPRGPEVVDPRGWCCSPQFLRQSCSIDAAKHALVCGWGGCWDAIWCGLGLAPCLYKQHKQVGEGSPTCC